MLIVSCPAVCRGLQGARIHLQQGFHRFMLNQISRNRSAAQRGADPDPLRDVQVGARAWVHCRRIHSQVQRPASTDQLDFSAARLLISAGF
jgi:hypothetical protein